MERVQSVDSLTGELLFDESEQPVMETVTSVEVIRDTPCVELIPAENLRISPASGWIDPINSSPYLIHLLPMFVCDVLDIIEQGENPKTGQPKWLKIDRKELYSGETEVYDSTRRAREGNRTDSKDDIHGDPRDYDIVWIHRNILRREGRDWIFYTVGTHIRLSDPVPLELVYPHAERERPYVMGCSVIESHRTYPAGPVELYQQLTAHSNDIINQRIDNVRLAMNRRYFVREGVNIDFKSLFRNVPGSVTRMTNPETDVKVIDTPDVTASAYREQDLVNVDFDEIAGQFSTSSVQSNRTLNETVGGMKMMQSGTNQIKEYEIRTITETWAERVLRQMVWMEAIYETDETILATAGKKLGIPEINAEIFDYNLDVSVNVAMGATDPSQKMERFSVGLNTIAGVMPDIAGKLNHKEVVTEVFGTLGYQDGHRFFKDLDQQGGGVDPEQAKLEAEARIQEQELELKRQEAGESQSLDREKMQADIAIEERKMQLEERKMELDHILNVRRMEFDQKIKVSQEKASAIQAKTAQKLADSSQASIKAAGTKHDKQPRS